MATPDVVGERMAGPGIRAWHFASELAKHFPTTLVARQESGRPARSDRASRPITEFTEEPCRARRSASAGGTPALLPILEWRSRDARAAMREAAVLIGQPARGFRRFRPGQRIIFDLFDPVLLELREMYGNRPSARQRIHFLAEQWRIRRALAQGDVLICATSKQRELYDHDPRIIEVPFGVDAGEGAGATQREDLIVWGGGTWEWLDPRTAVEAVVRLNRDGLPCRLLFLGRWRPNRELVDRRREDRFEQLLASGQPYVSANDEWVPYHQRLSWLRKSKIAMMLHRPTAEARYSIRTRLFDAIAAATPVITTEEGFAAELVESQRLGIVVPPSDVDAVARAARKLLRDDAFHATCVSNLERVRPRFAWPEVVRPLIEAVSRWQKQS
jgi:glycosyltransferase involved in cell wall biosynthesis